MAGVNTLSLADVLIKAGIPTILSGLIMALLNTYTLRRANTLADQKLLLDRSEANRKGDIEARDELRKELDRVHRIREALEADREEEYKGKVYWRDMYEALQLKHHRRELACATAGDKCRHELAMLEEVLKGKVTDG